MAKSKGILICEENRQEITKLIDKAHTGKEKNNVLDSTDIFDKLEELRKFEGRFLKKHLPNLCYIWSLNSKKANAYKYQYDADVAIFAWSKKGWILLNVTRDTFYPNVSNRTHYYWNLSYENSEIRKKEVKNHLYTQLFSR